MEHYHQILFNSWGNLDLYIRKNEYSKFFVLVDENTNQHCLPILESKLDLMFTPIQIESGEHHKTLTSCAKVWDEMIKGGADRHSLCINLGGGVIGDLGGFCASTYMRGMDFIQIPTSLLSQVDASVGGKLGVDYKGMKNFIGLIKDPNLVFIDPIFLNTLPSNQLRSGYAEVLKHGIIANKAYWDNCKGGLPGSENEAFWTQIIEDSVNIKKKVTQSDPLERGYRKILNYGHTIGHAIESIYLDMPKPFLHGEAIAIGMVCEAAIGYWRNMLSKEELHDISKHIIKIYGHFPEAVLDIDRLMKLMAHDKKNRGGSILCSIPKGIGDCAFNVSIDKEDVQKGLDYYKHFKGQ